MEYLYRRTTELTNKEKESILLLFKEVFNKNDRTLEEQECQYINNTLGYSFHVLVNNEDALIAHAAYTPSYYIINNQKVLMVDGVDGMIAKGYRDSTVLIDLLQFNRDNLNKFDVKFDIGFPNEYAMKVYTKGRLYKKVGEMSTNVLPYRIGGIRPKLKFLNPFSISFCRLWLFFCGQFASGKETKYMIEKDAYSYNETRYKRMDGKYSRVKIDDFEFMYKIMLYEGVRTAFLIDVTKKSAKNFNKAVKYIVGHESKDFDLILYVGNLYFSSHGLIKIPKKYEPKQFNFAIKVLDKSFSQDGLYDIRNWDVNLSNYDLI